MKISIIKPVLSPENTHRELSPNRPSKLPGKLFEKLIWLMERENTTPVQFAFRQHLSAEHCQHAYETQISKKLKQHLLTSSHSASTGKVTK